MAILPVTAYVCTNAALGNWDNGHRFRSSLDRVSGSILAASVENPVLLKCLPDISPESLSLHVLSKPVFADATWHRPISFALFSVLQMSSTCTPTLAIGGAADRKQGCLEAAEG